jgi:hypothetical protein
MVVLAPVLAALALAQSPPGEAVPLPAGPAASLLDGGVLPVGGTQLLGWAGYPDLGALYAQGLGPVDLGAGLQLRWDSGEMEATGFARLPLWRAGTSALAVRARLGLYLALGPSYGPYAHRNDTGLLVVPGLAFSTQAGQATFSLGVDCSFAATSRRGGGTIFAPAASAAIEVPLAGDVSAGARISFTRRWDERGAPGAPRSPDDVLELVALIGYRLF